MLSSILTWVKALPTIGKVALGVVVAGSVGAVA